MGAITSLLGMFGSSGGSPSGGGSPADMSSATSTAVATGGNITETPTSWVMPVVIGIVVIVLAGVFLLARKKGK